MNPSVAIFAGAPNEPTRSQPVDAAPSAANAPVNATVAAALDRAVAQLEAATTFLGSRFIERLIENAVAVATAKAQSPLCDRAGAAALALCDVSTIDRAVKAGILKAHYLGESPRFEKAQVLEAITSGRWTLKNTNHREHKGTEKL